MKKRKVLSYEENYLLGYMEGFRIGTIEGSRKALFLYLHLKNKGQGTVPSKRLIQKINRESDYEFLLHLACDVRDDKLNVEEVEMYYDMYFLVPDGEKDKKVLWRSPFLKEGDVPE